MTFSDDVYILVYHSDTQRTYIYSGERNVQVKFRHRQLCSAILPPSLSCVISAADDYEEPVIQHENTHARSSTWRLKHVGVGVGVAVYQATHKRHGARKGGSVACCIQLETKARGN
jgi:hypothetical protein